jgi:hypothetical protein
VAHMRAGQNGGTKQDNGTGHLPRDKRDSGTRIGVPLVVPLLGAALSCPTRVPLATENGGAIPARPQIPVQSRPDGERFPPRVRTRFSRRAARLRSARPREINPRRAAMKTCSHCHKRRIRRNFPPNAQTRDGLSSWCRSCHVEATRAWRAREHRAGRRSVGGRKK